MARETQPVIRDRLPTLNETLRRVCAAPVDLYCLYLFMQASGSEDQHQNLCSAYFRDLKKKGGSVQDEWPEYYQLARRRGSMYNRINDITHDPHAEEDRYDEKAGRAHAAEDRPDMRTPSPTARAMRDGHLSPTIRALYPSEQDQEARPRRSLGGNRREPVQPIIHRDAAITRTDLIASAEVIYAKYLLQGADKEIYLPPALRIHDFPLSAERLPHMSHPQYDVESEALARIPDMFNRQKEYVYRAMEVDSFPRFLRAKSFGNLTPISALVRLAIGLLALWAGLATAFALIFLDKPKTLRLWIILPLAVAVLLILSHSYDLDPVLVFLGLSETTPFRTLRIREPYVKRLLLGRALWVTFLTIFITAVLVLIFAFVPGHRL